MLTPEHVGIVVPGSVSSATSSSRRRVDLKACAADIVGTKRKVMKLRLKTLGILPPACKEVEEPAETGNKSSDIGVGGGVERFGHALHFVGVDDTKANKLLFGSRTRVELDRQGD